MIIVGFDAVRRQQIAVDESDVTADRLAAVFWQTVELGPSGRSAEQIIPSRPTATGSGLGEAVAATENIRSAFAATVGFRSARTSENQVMSRTAESRHGQGHGNFHGQHFCNPDRPARGRAR